MNKNVVNQALDSVIGECFGRYAKYVIQDRALPDIRDGLKPVQRRILYAMNELGLTFDKAYKKSARTVGEVIGKYHPHGDSSIYEAMVRMSQSWKNNLPLLDMHGNNGSIDGDPAAAMRYTECRLSQVSQLMLEKIKSDTVDFMYNFDDSEKEPTILPAMIPNLLINGAVGIAAGYATNIPPFNPCEIFDAASALIDNPNLTVKQIQKLIPGPDFPTGGIIEGQQGIDDFYNSGKGKFLISSKINFNYDDKKINQIIINEIPYDTNKSQIIKELNDILYEEKISGLIEVRDESDKNGVNIVIDIKKDKNLEIIKNYLLKNTHLQINYAVNFVAIVDRKPVLLDLVSALQHYITHALDIQKKTAIFDLKKCQKRYEIVNGLILAINNIDEVIKIIRASDSKENAKENLINKFNFTDNQAEAIVVLRLYRLSKTNITDLIHESQALKQMINELEALINSELLQKESLKKLLHNYKQTYYIPRKTTIVSEIQKLEINDAEILDVQDIYLFLSRDGYLKTVSKKMYEANFFSDLGHNTNDFVFFSKLCKTNQNLLIISQLGKTLMLPIHKIKSYKWKDIGEHINSYMNLTANDKIIFANIIDDINDNDGLIITTKHGLIKKMVLSEAFNTKQIKQSLCCKLKLDDHINFVSLISMSSLYFVTLINNQSRGYSFSSAEIPLLTKNASGVKSMKLKPQEYLVGAMVSKTLLLNCYIVTNKAIKSVKLTNFNVSSRVAVGKNIVDIDSQEKIINCIWGNNLSFINLMYSDNTMNSVSVNNYKSDKIITDAYFSYSNSHNLFEDLNKAAILPKSVSDNVKDEQLSYEIE